MNRHTLLLTIITALMPINGSFREPVAEAKTVWWGKLILIAKINWAFLYTWHCARPFTCISFFISQDSKAGMIVVPTSLLRKIRHWIKVIFKVILFQNLPNPVDLYSVFSAPLSFCSNPATPQMRAWESSENSVTNAGNKVDWIWRLDAKVISQTGERNRSLGRVCLRTA